MPPVWSGCVESQITLRLRTWPRLAWTKGSALFSREGKGKLSFGLRVPLPRLSGVAQKASNDCRRKWQSCGASRAWLKVEVQGLMDEMGWDCEIMQPLKGVWHARSDVQPQRAM
eukprot:768962-Amphidinium_carterae.1